MLAVLLAGVAPRSFAQRVDVAFARASTTHDLLHEPTGPAVAVSMPLYKRVAASVSIQRLRGTSTGTGVVCGGLINPDRCPTEPFDQTGRMFVIGLGAEVALLNTPIVRLSARPEVVFANARTQTQGRSTTNTLSAERQHVGASIGADVSIYPSRHSPVGVSVGAAHARVHPATRYLVVDGYDPFSYRWFSANTLTLGATVDWGRARRRS